jgi:hypothetical protein
MKESMGNLPSSDLAAILHALFLIPNIALQYLLCIFSYYPFSSKDNKSHIVPFLFVLSVALNTAKYSSGNQTSQYYTTDIFSHKQSVKV